VANQVALVGMREGWGVAFVREAYRRWFQLGQETGSEPNVSESLRQIGQDARRVMELSSSQEYVDLLAAETHTAEQLGVFGSPTFTVEGDLFWGDDRLDDAIKAFGKQDKLSGKSGNNPSGAGDMTSKCKHLAQG
jgi:2-hydroxychromene-2-carboxylate isomerase